MSSNYFKIDSSSGSGDKTVTVTTLGKNTTAEKRNGRVTVSSPTTVAPTKTVELVQYYAPRIQFVGDPVYYPISAKGGTLTLNIDSPYDFWFANVPSVVSSINWDGIDWKSRNVPAGQKSFTVTVLPTVEPERLLYNIQIAFNLFNGTVSINNPDGKYGFSASFAQNPTTESFPITITTDTSLISKDGETRTITVECEGRWLLTSNVGNIEFEPVTGVGNQTVTVTYPKNETYEIKDITITGQSGANRSTVNLQQEASIMPYIRFVPDTVNFNFDANEIAYRVETNQGDYSVESNNDWITLVDGKVVVEANAGDDRVGTVTATAGDLTAEMKIYQASAIQPITLTLIPDVVDHEGGVVVVEVDCNGLWELQEVSGLVLSKTSGGGYTRLTATVPENETFDGKTFDIIGTSGSYRDKKTISQKSATPYINVEPNEYEFGYEGGTTTITVESNIDWEVTDNE